MSKQYRAVCGHCLRTFLTEEPEEVEFCWKCGEGLIYISGEEIIKFQNKGVVNESNI